MRLKQSNAAYYIALIALFVILKGCNASDFQDVSNQCDEVEKNMDELLDIQRSSETTSGVAVDFSYAIQKLDGKTYEYMVGSSTLNERYASASASKLPTALIILKTVDDTDLTLDSHPQDFIPNWTIPERHPLREITLGNLLSMTSGFRVESNCQFNLGTDDDFDDFTFEQCVKIIGLQNLNVGILPNEEYHYAGMHLQVAGYMAVKAAGFETWQQLFEKFQADTGLLTDSVYDSPSVEKPFLGGGMQINALDYLDLLMAMEDGSLLSEESMSELLADQIAERGARINFSPMDITNEDWHYSFGMFHECESISFTNCAPGIRMSDPGLYSFYPYWDNQSDYVGVVARRGSVASVGFGIRVERVLRPLAKQWLTCEE